MDKAVTPEVLEEKLKNLKEDVEEVKSDVKAIRGELTSVVKYIERSKGWAGAGLLLASMVGGALVKVIIG